MKVISSEARKKARSRLLARVVLGSMLLLGIVLQVTDHAGQAVPPRAALMSANHLRMLERIEVIHATRTLD